MIAQTLTVRHTPSRYELGGEIDWLQDDRKALDEAQAELRHVLEKRDLVDETSEATIDFALGAALDADARALVNEIEFLERRLGISSLRFRDPSDDLADLLLERLRRDLHPTIYSIETGDCLPDSGDQTVTAIMADGGRQVTTEGKVRIDAVLRLMKILGARLDLGQ